MNKQLTRFGELVSEGAKLHPSLWKATGELNLTALARFYEKKGHPVSQPTLQRTFFGKYVPSNETIEATYRVFGIPRELLRGDHEADMNDLIKGYGLTTLLLAKRMSQLPKDDFDAIATQIELATMKAEKLKALMQESRAVVAFERKRHG